MNLSGAPLKGRLLALPRPESPAQGHNLRRKNIVKSVPSNDDINATDILWFFHISHFYWVLQDWLDWLLCKKKDSAYTFFTAYYYSVDAKTLACHKQAFRPKTFRRKTSRLPGKWYWTYTAKTLKNWCLPLNHRNLMYIEWSLGVSSHSDCSTSGAKIRCKNWCFISMYLIFPSDSVVLFY